MTSAKIVFLGLAFKLSKKVLFHEDTQVIFDTLSDEVIDAYIATKVPLDHKQD